jgi:spore coat polysaccharide biosynthesis predicted glycosyltransferase SpsG
LIEINEREALDIDDYNDWAVAAFQISRRNILIRADAGLKLGMGHVYRALALAQELASHNLVIATREDDGYELGATFLGQFPYRVERFRSEEAFFDFARSLRPDILMLDILDTEREYMEQLREHTAFLVTLENLGSGAQLADIVINDLYSDLYPQETHWYGVENAILSPYFETVGHIETVRASVDHILITFGGTDPQNLTRKSLMALGQIGYSGTIRVVLGPGYRHYPIRLDEFGLNGEILQSVKNMAEVARTADMALTSAGRTVTEMMTLGLPTIVMCQNLRELRHTHASSVFGVINLGLGEYVDVASLAKHIEMLMDEHHLRIDMHERTLKAVRNRSNARIVQRILDAAAMR